MPQFRKRLGRCAHGRNCQWKFSASDIDDWNNVAGEQCARDWPIGVAGLGTTAIIRFERIKQCPIGRSESADKTDI
jgi:hypothetical protein